MSLQSDLFRDVPARLAWAREALIDAAWDRFVAKVDARDPLGCWFWTGATRRGGGKSPGSPLYGAFWFDGGMRVAHIFMAIAAGLVWALGLHLDHTCCNSLCVNPLHLEPVTCAENNRRRWWALRSRKLAA